MNCTNEELEKEWLESKFSSFLDPNSIQHDDKHNNTLDNQNINIDEHHVQM